MTGYSSWDWWWIGLHDRNTEGTFEWVDGSTVSYTNWNSGQPDDYWGEDCAHLYTTGYWNDMDCGYDSYYTRDLYYICEATVSY